MKQREAFIAQQHVMEKRWWAESKREAKAIEKLLSQKLGQLGLDFIFNLDGHKIRRFVKFQSVEITKDRYVFHVDSQHLPHGITELAITKDEVITGLQCTLRKPVSYHLDVSGLFLMIDREHGLADIPRTVMFEDVTNATHPSDGPLCIPIGMTNGRKPIKIDLQHDTTAHFLIGGATGAGKTNLLHAMVMSLARRTPHDVNLALIDLKGFEFPQYSELPHLIYPVVTEPADVLPLIKELWDEAERRKGILRNSGVVNNIKAYNARREYHQQVPYIVVFFDELANVMLDKTLKHRSEIESYLARLAGLSRAVGIHLVLATQRPSKEVLTPLISANFPGRIGLACASIYDSMVIVGNGDACFHESVPPGRAVLSHGRFRTPMQIALITDGRRQEIIGDAMAGKFGTPRMYHDVTMQEMAQFALENWNGVFKQRALWQQFQSRGVSEYDVRRLSKRYRHEPFEIDGAKFILTQDGESTPVYIIPYRGEMGDGGSEPIGEGTQASESSGPSDTATRTVPRSAPLKPYIEQQVIKAAEMRERALVYLLSHPNASVGELGRELHVHATTASGYIKRLQDEGRLRRDGNGWEASAPIAETDDEYSQFQQRVTEMIGENNGDEVAPDTLRRPGGSARDLPGCDVVDGKK